LRGLLQAFGDTIYEGAILDYITISTGLVASMGLNWLLKALKMTDFIPVYIHDLPKLTHPDGPIHLLDIHPHIILHSIDLFPHLLQPILFLHDPSNRSHPRLSVLIYL